MAQPPFTFIDARPLKKAQSLQIRREIRSHAARVVVCRDRSLSHPTRRPPHKKRRESCPTWKLHISPKAQGEAQGEEGLPIPPRRPATASNSLLLTTPSGTSMIPASTSPIYYHPLVSVVLDNYLQHLAVAVPELDGDSRSALLQTLWFPMVLSSPIVFQVIVLFSASHYASLRNDLTLAETILSLKQCALSGIARALSSDTRGLVVRDEMISAVAKMASYEAIFGEESAYHCHMKAVEMMLKLRGGLTALGLEGFLSRLLVFIDTNSAFLLNTHLHFRGSSFPKLANPFIMPNPSRFVGEV
ncbi:uncharacterized protein A1O5_07375 [Cladophialophora psammophila CBS 110553]|uniref:Transcription factor domain-containing protein n=1 Tax=Cladophialophora psammophila CBS 110553 TaxID=1182543 RepID=W9XG58_9EURO|nr:uncharacterized protein A1O5_07375 [Cladophialophora psammophila CBS 110553]EXJ69339.1 hypothetical protein A1O5_07375 [Cladophialophora psammophila CBS 110553]